MYSDFKGNKVYFSTGGLNLVKDKETLCFVHGAGQNHYSFTQQIRYFASQGYNVLAPDFPGHGFSDGNETTSIEEDMLWLYELLSFLKVEKATFIGHSQGCLTILELAEKKPELVMGLVFVAGAMSIPVNDFLIDTSINNPEKAYDLMVTWGQDSYGSFSISDWPGHNHLAEGNAVMKMNDSSVLSSDLKSCNLYDNGKQAASKIKINCLAVLAKFDMMTPLKKGLQMAENIKKCDYKILECGHFLPIEKPKELNVLIKNYLNSFK